MRGLTYLAGPILSASDAEAIDWRAEAARYLGGCVIDPMTRDYRGVEDLHVAEIVEGDLRDLARADSVLAFCWRPSFGTAMELVYAYAMGTPIVAVVPSGPVSPWLRYHAATVVRTLEEGLRALPR